MLLYNKMPGSGGTKLVNLMELSPGMAQKAFPKAFVGIEMTNSSIIKWSTGLKWAGRGAGLLGVGAGVLDMHTKGEINWENGLLTGMSIVALVPGGQTVAAIYFGVDLVVTLTTGRSIGANIDYYCKAENREDFNTRGFGSVFEDSPAVEFYEYLSKQAKIFKSSIRVPEFIIIPNDTLINKPVKFIDSPIYHNVRDSYSNIERKNLT